MRKEILKTALWIFFGCLFYALGTCLFIFPLGLLLGGTSGIAVILNAFLPVSSGTILMIINFALLVLALVILGREMALKTLLGSALTTVMIGAFETLFAPIVPLCDSLLMGAVLGAGMICVGGAMLFYVDASSGGTDIAALIVRKYLKADIGKCLLLTDVLIVLLGGILSGWTIGLCSFLGLLIKTLGIDFVIAKMKKMHA